MSENTKSKNAYNIIPITINDRNTVMDFLYKLFFRDEPLNASVDLMNEENVIESLKSYSNKLFDNGELQKYRLLLNNIFVFNLKI